MALHLPSLGWMNEDLTVKQMLWHDDASKKRVVDDTEKMAGSQNNPIGEEVSKMVEATA